MKKFDLLIKNGKMVSSQGVKEGNIYVSQGKTAALTSVDVLWEAENSLEASGKFVFPGMVDCHVHLNDPGFTWREDFEHGTLAAAAGGVTTIIDMPLQNEPALTNARIFQKKHRAIKDKALIDYAFWGGLIGENIDQIEELHQCGVTSFKVFIGPVSPDYRSLDMGTVREALQRTANLGALIGFHAEDYSIIKHEEARAEKEGRSGRADFLRSRPLLAELITTDNLIALCRETGARIHICHVSHPDVAEKIQQAQKEGLPVTAETCTHYLIFSEEDFLRDGMFLKCAPPLREINAIDRLWDYVLNGTLSCIASDHSPCTLSEKREENGAFMAWGGISGLQSTMQILFEHAVNRRGLCPSLLAARLAEGASRIFGLYGRKGAIEVGFDADYVIFDPEKKWEINPESLYYLNRFSAFSGQKGKGLPSATLVRGQIVYMDGEQKADFGYGELVKRLKNTAL